jgi:hypothetical protein
VKETPARCHFGKEERGKRGNERKETLLRRRRYRVKETPARCHFGKEERGKGKRGNERKETLLCRRRYLVKETPAQFFRGLSMSCGQSHDVLCQGQREGIYSEKPHAPFQTGRKELLWMFEGFLGFINSRRSHRNASRRRH